MILFNINQNVNSQINNLKLNKINYYLLHYLIMIMLLKNNKLINYLMIYYKKNKINKFNNKWINILKNQKLINMHKNLVD